MLEEYKNVHQYEGEPRRRWFADDYFDLIVWYNEDDIVEFRLCYEKFQKAICWKRPSLIVHTVINDGEDMPYYKSTPTMAPDGVFDFQSIVERFRNNSRQLDSNISEFVYNKISTNK